MLLIVLPISAIFLYYRPSDLGLQPDNGRVPSKIETSNTLIQSTWTFDEARRTWAFWLILMVGFGALFSVRLLTVHQIAAAVDAGISRATAATIMGTSGLIVIAAFIGWGAISDRLGRRRTYVLSSIAMAAAYLTLLAVQTETDLMWLYLYAVLVGLGEGSRSSLVTAVMNDTFPGNASGYLTGWVGFAFGAGSAVGSWLAGVLFDLTGNYDAALWTGFGVTVLSALCMALLGTVGHRPLKL
ncbi:MAG: MFS transporter, partial [Chloroflexota bacterium]